MAVKLEYEANWNGGRIHITAESLAELNKTIDQLDKSGHRDNIAPVSPIEVSDGLDQYPMISPSLGCADAIKALLATEWGKQPRTESELTAALKFNSLHYSRGSISSILYGLYKKEILRRPNKKNGSYAFVLVNKETPRSQELLVTA